MGLIINEKTNTPNSAHMKERELNSRCVCVRVLCVCVECICVCMCGVYMQCCVCMCVYVWVCVCSLVPKTPNFHSSISENWVWENDCNSSLYVCQVLGAQLMINPLRPTSYKAPPRGGPAAYPSPAATSIGPFEKGLTTGMEHLPHLVLTIDNP